MLTETDISTLIENGRKQEAVAGTDNELDFWPVVRLFDPISQAYWLLTEIAPDDPGMAFGLADLGLGAPELGNIEISALSEISAFIRFDGRADVRRDDDFVAVGPISLYAEAAQEKRAFCE